MESSPDCRIWYTYDNAGQRVKRSYYCIEEGGVQPSDHPIKIDQYPNPTHGPVVVVSDIEVDVFIVRIFSMLGVQVAYAECENCNYLTVDISNQPPGSYVVQASVQKLGYSNLQEGFTLIKDDE
ncbi:MAG TPA: T9SS type A sorting domain-containing protein [Flavipsychrobacter sp.]|nr:T9SS type A sorting domain-containing protein [Flavipsychrobacter sp.]